MSVIKCVASMSLAAIILPTLHAEPHCPGNVAGLPFRFVQRSLVILFLLALASDAKSVLAQTAALQVQMYDYTGLNPAALQMFVTRIQQILTDAGISVEVNACARGTSAPCESRRGSFRQVVIRVLANAPNNNKNVRWQHLGQSIANHDGGVYATIFLKLAEDKADEASVSPILVLSYAAAHEVGHLLLGDDAHASEGLMRAHWKNEDFQAMAQRRLHFTPEQTRELKRRYGASHFAETGAGTSIADGMGSRHQRQSIQ